VACTDGVGTKLKLAFMMNKHDTVGVDLVAMNANDLVVCGAEPLLFLDYFAAGHLEVGVAEQVISGIADGCKQAGCALIGGETAELPGFYAKGEYDLAGFCVGVVDKDKVINGKHAGTWRRPARPRVDGLPFQRLLAGAQACSSTRPAWIWRASPPISTARWAKRLLCPTRIYVRALRRLAASGLMKGAAHITGGGLVDNPTRMFPAHRQAEAANRPAHVAAAARVRHAGAPGPCRPEEMRRTFNMGIGMIVAVPAGAADAAQSISRVGRREGLHHRLRPARGPGGRARGVHRMKTGVLASGSGTNLQVAHRRLEKQGTLAPAELVVVGANILGCLALERAQKAGIESFVLSHKAFATREDFDRALVAELRKRGVELVVLAGFMRVLTVAFLDAFPLRVINIHPALLPAFPGVHGAEAGLRLRRESSPAAPCTSWTKAPTPDPSSRKPRCPCCPATDEDSLQPAHPRSKSTDCFPPWFAPWRAGKVSVEGRRVRVEAASGLAERDVCAA
jgi:phosphoribosylaminoimidazole (AIR) synthetase